MDCCTHLRLPELLQPDVSPVELFAWGHLVNAEGGEACHESDADAVNRSEFLYDTLDKILS